MVTVVAGPGFGKTALLAAALGQDGGRGRGRDVWLSCEPADESDINLRRGLAAACGLAGDVEVDAICDWVWSLAPEPVCLVLDDVHEIPARSAGATVLARLVAELPGNGHVLLASREPVPVPIGRLAASGQLTRVREDDLVLDDSELELFARARHVEVGLLASTGGWPALAELTASAGADLVVDYIWEEVLTRIGADRARLLARFALVGGGDDDIASALAGRPMRVRDLVAGLPLIERSAAGPAALHPLWTPTLRSLLAADEADDARRTAAAVHRRAGRLHDAIDLLAESGSWDDALDVIRDAATTLSGFSAADFGRWYRKLPRQCRNSPVALLAAGLDVRPRLPMESIAFFDGAIDGFRQAGDVDGEVAALSGEGLVLWWANDVMRLFALHQRVVELSASGSTIARFMAQLGQAAIAHLMGDSAAVFAALADVDDIAVPTWVPVVAWLRSVAHRRNGDLERAVSVLVTGDDHPETQMYLNNEMARLRALWVVGTVDEACDTLPALRDGFEHSGDHFNAVGVMLEFAARRAWLGHHDPAGIDDIPQMTGDEAQSPMVLTVRLLAMTAIAVERGDEAAAARFLRAHAVPMIGRPDGWYLWDRGGGAFIHVLVPEARPAWEAEPLTGPHRTGLELARVLEAARDGDLGPASAMRWPSPGVVRSQLPMRWVVELMATGLAAGNAPPDALIAAIGSQLRPALKRLAEHAAVAPEVVAAASRMTAALPALPAGRLTINVLGPLEIWHDERRVADSNVRRQRVRELLCFLVVRGRARREEITEELWPELDDRGRNLRVTLNYLQRVLQPERGASDPPYFLRSSGPWLSLEGTDRLEVDAWQLTALLDEADRCERAGTPAAALAAYTRALLLWRGDPFADVPYAVWAEPERARLRLRYTTAAIRAGELQLASGAGGDARSAAQRAIDADPTLEPAYQLLARSHLAEDNVAGARRAVDACVTALAQLDVRPEPATLALVPPTG